MAFYDYLCPNDHITEKMFSIAAKPDTISCPECNEEAKSVILKCPNVNDPSVRVLDYPGSKKLKAGYVHSHADMPAERVSSGYGGVVNRVRDYSQTKEIGKQGLWKNPIGD